MIAQVIKKCFENPVQFIILAFNKLFVGPIKYRDKEGYNAAAYWHDRFSRYGTNIKGPGEEGLNVIENQRRYERVTQIFRELCVRVVAGIDKVRVLEIGTGTGLITKSLNEIGVKDYLGIDITDALFPVLKTTFPGFTFYKLDITKDIINGKYDLVVIIDVIEHIVNEPKFHFAMNNLKGCLSETGVIIVAPLVTKNKKYLFYERHWTAGDLRKYFSDGYAFDLLIPWEEGFSYITAIRRSVR